MKNRPNIVYITSHDTGRHFGCYGIKEVQTPNLDALAEDGVKFEKFFCTSPVCSASRGSMMTGLYPQTNGIMALVHPPCNSNLYPGVKHLSKILQDIGYHTALFHHQHEVMPDKVGERLNFNEYLVKQDKGFSPSDIGRAFSDFISGYDKEKPFYAQIGFGLTHRDWKSDNTQPDTKKGVYVPPYLKDTEAAREDLAWLQGAVKHLDSSIGIILDAIKTSPLGKNTIVVFTVDHGIEVLRSKWTLYDAGIEVAFIMRWPEGGISGGKAAVQLLSNVDMTPTLLELIGEKVPAYMQGKSFADVCRNPKNGTGRGEIFAEYVQAGNNPEARCIRTEKYKLIRNFSDHRLFKVPVDIKKPEHLVDRTSAKKDESFCPVVELYDIEKDPLETKNLAGNPKYAAVEKGLDKKLWRWLEEVKDPILKSPMQPHAYKSSIADYKKYKKGSKEGK